MPTYLAKVAYNGKEFYGFQRQSFFRSVQGEIESCLSMILGDGEDIVIHGAGRTDRGVHATGQRFSFYSDSPIGVDPTLFLHNINRLLPKDITILDIQEVEDGFDARHSSIKKVYRYKFMWGQKDPFHQGTVTQLPLDGFDVALFKEAISSFLGKHNFQNFTTKPEDVGGFLRTIDKIDVEIDEEKRYGEVRFLGDGFMTYMVRILMGSAFKCAYHKWTVEELRSALEAKERKIIPYKADPDGLYLEDVIYE